MAYTSVAQTGKRRVVKKWGFGMAPSQEAVKAIRGRLDEFGLREGQPLC